VIALQAYIDRQQGNFEEAIQELKEAITLDQRNKVSLQELEFTDALSGPRNLINLAVVYAWTNELDAAFATLGSLTKTPFGIYYGQLKLDPIWDPLRKDPLQLTA
jgi:tetratricopeptide (TPR) repeat protein